MFTPLISSVRRRGGDENSQPVVECNNTQLLLLFLLLLFSSPPPNLSPSPPSSFVLCLLFLILLHLLCVGLDLWSCSEDGAILSSLDWGATSLPPDPVTSVPRFKSGNQITHTLRALPLHTSHQSTHPLRALPLHTSHLRNVGVLCVFVMELQQAHAGVDT